MLGRERIDPRPCRSAAGEGDLRDLRMLHERFADHGSIACDNIDNARGNVSFGYNQLHELKQ